MFVNRVLVVVPETTQRHRIRELLHAAGFLVQTAATAAQALATAGSFVPDLAVLDLVLPDADGFVLAGRLRIACGRERLPVIALCGTLGRPSLAAVIAAHLDGVIGKPVSAAALLHEVHAVLCAPRRALLTLPKPSEGVLPALQGITEILAGAEHEGIETVLERSLDLCGCVGSAIWIRGRGQELRLTARNGFAGIDDAILETGFGCPGLLAGAEAATAPVVLQHERSDGGGAPLRLAFACGRFSVLAAIGGPGARQGVLLLTLQSDPAHASRFADFARALGLLFDQALTLSELRGAAHVCAPSTPAPAADARTGASRRSAK
jgi:CheY-like chemotaxis protein